MLELTKSSDNRNIDDVDKTMDEINEQTENMKQIQEALSAPIGAAADFDEVINKPLYPFPTQTTSLIAFKWRKQILHSLAMLLPKGLTIALFLL